MMDLTHKLSTKIDVYPGDQPPVIDQQTYGKVAMTTLTVSMHTGTHIDAPRHMIPGGKLLSDYPLERFIGDAIVLDARQQATIETLEGLENVHQGMRVLLRTDHSARFGQDDYYTAYPVLSLDLARVLIAKGITMLGFDTPSPDTAPYLVHASLFQNDILIVENLTNLNTLPIGKVLTLYALPLAIDAEASIARVIAKLDK